LSTRLKEKEEKIFQILETLREESSSGTPIVVEGIKDVEALRELEVRGLILTVKTGGKSFLEVVSEIEKKGGTEAILLLDFDRRGREGTKRLKQLLERARIKSNTKFWRKLSGIAGRDIQCIEGLTGYLRTLHAKIMAWGTTNNAYGKPQIRTDTGQ
jgi:5S rRNA maturation endonuclease (ribonuclease M5)